MKQKRRTDREEGNIWWRRKETYTNRRRFHRPRRWNMREKAGLNLARDRLIPPPHPLHSPPWWTWEEWGWHHPFSGRSAECVMPFGAAAQTHRAVRRFRCRPSCVTHSCSGQQHQCTVTRQQSKQAQSIKESRACILKKGQQDNRLFPNNKFTAACKFICYFFYPDAMCTVHEIEWRSQSLDCNTKKHSSTNRRTHTLVNSRCLCVTFYRKCPEWQTWFTGPSGSAVHLSWQNPDGKRNRLVPGWCHLIVKVQRGRWATQCIFIEWKVPQCAVPPFSPHALSSAIINPEESVKLACHIKTRVEWPHTSQSVPVRGGLSTWICVF